MKKYIIDSSDPSNVKIIANESITADEVIGLWVTDYKTERCRVLWQQSMIKSWYETNDLGRYCNHDDVGNVTVELRGNEIVLISKGISANEEILVNYKMVEQLTGYKVNLDFLN
jgi:predicted transcriptional regulator